MKKEYKNIQIDIITGFTANLLYESAFDNEKSINDWLENESGF